VEIYSQAWRWNLNADNERRASCIGASGLGVLLGFHCTCSEDLKTFEHTVTELVVPVSLRPVTVLLQSCSLWGLTIAEESGHPVGRVVLLISMLPLLDWDTTCCSCALEQPWSASSLCYVTRKQRLSLRSLQFLRNAEESGLIMRLACLGSYLLIQHLTLAILIACECASVRAEASLNVSGPALHI